MVQKGLEPVVYPSMGRLGRKLSYSGRRRDSTAGSEISTKSRERDESTIPSSSTSRTPPTPSSRRPRKPSQSTRTIPLLLLSILLLITTLIPFTKAIKFEVPASHTPQQKCVWNYAMSDTLVVITVNVDKGPYQRVDMEVVDGSNHRNIYQTKKGILGETRMAITTHADADLGICFKNTLEAQIPETQAHNYRRSVDLDVDIGAEAVDYNAIAKAESLSGLEVEMRKLEGVVKEIVDELNYLKRREAKLRDTNESTNARVQNFAVIVVLTLIILGTWQIFYLRSYFKSKYLID